MLNPEQKKAVLYNKGPLLIVAGAGTGKTTVIVEKIKHLIKKKLARPEEILALTFTEKAASEMVDRVDREMPYGYFQMWISTFHSFADQVLKEEASHIGISPGYRLMTTAETVIFLKSNLFLFDLKYFRPLGNPNKFLESLLQHFSRLRDENIDPSDYLIWAKKYKPEEKNEKEKSLELANAYKTYQSLKIKQNLFDYGDLIYYLVKLFKTRKNILKSYQQKFKYVLIDEFQDTNIAQYDLLKLLCPPIKNPHFTVVGDDSQCLPANSKIKTENGIRRIDKIKINEKIYTAVGKGYTSCSKVKKIFKKKGKFRLITLTLESGERITTTDNHKMFCFTPSIALDKSFFYVYIMHQRNLGWRIGITNDLATRLRIEHHADEIIGIASFKAEEEARFYESYYSAKYGLPTVPFSPRQRQAIAGVWLEKLFRDIDTTMAVKALANDLRLELDSPHCLTSGVNRGISERIIVNLQMCYRNYRSKYDKEGFLKSPAVQHITWIETSSLNIINKLKKAGFELTNAKKGSRLRYSSTDLVKVWKMAYKLSKITGGIIDKKFAVGTNFVQHRPARIMPASHIIVGNYLPVCQGKRIIYKKVIGKSIQTKTIEVYDLEVEKTHNFIANGIVVHNSIYKFRGASVSNILAFMKDYKKARQITLMKNYRSNQIILDSAYRLIKNNDPDTLEARLGISKKLIAQKKTVEKDPLNFFYSESPDEEAEYVAREIIKLKKNYRLSDIAILTRANNHSQPFINAFIRLGIPFQFLGPSTLYKQPEVKDLIAYLKVLNSPDDSISLFRLFNMEIFKTDIKDLTLLMSFAKRTNLSLFTAVEVYLGLTDPDIKTEDYDNYRKFLPFLSKDSRKKIHKVYSMVNKHLSRVKKDTAGQILFYFLEDSGLLMKLTNYSSEKDEQIALNISKFFNKLKTFESDHEDATVSAVVEYIDMSMELGESPIASQTDIGEYNAVNVITAHSAKGLEFKVVFLVNLTRGRFPTVARRETIPIPVELIKEILPSGDYHMQEERRLFYVGVTRAKEKVYMTASRFYGQGKRVQKVSPFVLESLGNAAVERTLNTKKDQKQQLSIFDFRKPKEPVLKEKYFQNSFSYTQLETYLRCPLQYKYHYILKIPTPPTAAIAFGDSIHKALQKFYLEFMEDKSVNLKRLLKIYEKTWLPVGYASSSHESRMKKEGEKILTGYFKRYHDEKLDIVAIEKPFKIKVARDIYIVGKIDRVDGLAEKNIEIIDYKTGKQPDEKELKKSLQLSIYAMAATDRGLYDKKLSEVVLSFYYLQEPIKTSFQKKPEELVDTKEKIMDIVGKIRTNDFSPTPGRWCDFCPFKMICEAWQ